MPQVIIYDVSDSEDETEQAKGSNESTEVELDPELMLYLDQLPSINVKQDEIQRIVNRYVCDDSIKSEVSHDLYADPIPSCSHQNVETLKVPDDPSNKAPSISYQNGSNANPISYSLHEKLSFGMFSDNIYDNPTPGCSHYDDAQNIWTEKKKKHEPDLDIEMCPCSSTVCDTVGEPNGSLNDVQVPEPVQIESLVEGNKSNVETLSITDTSESILLSNQPVMQSNDINSLNDNVLESDMEPSIYKEPLESLSLLFHQINGLHKTRIGLNQEDYIAFCAKIVKLKSNHSLLISEIEKGNLIKFEQLVVWGRNLKRNVEDLIIEAKPNGSSFDEAKKFVFKMMHTEIRYRQHLADSNETYIFDDTNHYKFHCMACDRRDDNLTWLVAHLCRDTAEMIYMCCFCGFLFFNNICSLIYHVILDLLEEPKKEYCVECQGFFPSVANHLMDIEGSWKVSCNSCDFISLSQCSLSIHQRYHKMEKHHVCPECGAYFVFFEILENHIRNYCYFYSKKIRHICPICAIIFRDKESLSRHLFSIHHQRWIKCIQCHMLLISRIQYISHRAQNHPESPCTYQICHTCILCPGREFKSSAAQFHMKNHANDVINVIILYVCDCNYYTIHKNNFIEHKAQNCEAAPSFGKWDNDHEMKICGICNDVKFVNLSKPFICEDCEILNSPQSVVSSLTKTYQCKVCKMFLIYKWEAVIEHFFCFHPNISVHKFPNCVKSTHISGLNNDWISKSSNPANSLQTFPNPHTRFCENPRKMFLKMSRNNNISSNIINRNVAKAQPVGKKQTTKKKCTANNVPFYNSLSHFMASNSAASSNQVKREFQKNNTTKRISNISLLPQSNDDVSIRMPEQSVSVEYSTIPREGSDILLANNVYLRQNSLAVDIKQKATTMLCVSSNESKKNEPSSSSGNLLCGKNGIIEAVTTPNQSGVIVPENSVHALIKTPESSDKTTSKSNIIYVKRTIDPNLSDKINNHSIKTITNISSEDMIKTDAEINLIPKKTSLECKKCQYKCNEAVELVKHFVDAHYIQGTYQCMECGDCFANLKNKINHLRSTHKIDTKCYLEPDFNRLDTCRSQFKCPVCLRGFLSEQDKNLHMRCHGMAYLKSIRSTSKEM